MFSAAVKDVGVLHAVFLNEHAGILRIQFNG
jgi:hypothetical protein